MDFPTPRFSTFTVACLLLASSTPFAADAAPLLNVGLQSGQLHLEISGSGEEGVAVLYRSSLTPDDSWQLLTYAVLKNGTASLNLGAPDSETQFYQLANNVGTTWTDLAWVPAGTFLMGSPITEEGRDNDEGPQRAVTLTSGYWIGRREVTQLDYLSLIGNNPSSTNGLKSYPVESVSWADAQTYCQKLTAQKRAAGQIPAGYAFRLPTEAEWEYAARSGSTNRFSFGSDPGYVELGGYAWYLDNSGGTEHEVGVKKPNAWGLFDMSGNVWEWCQDWYSGYPSGPQNNPLGPVAGSEKVVRGGSYYYDAWLTRCAARLSYPPSTANNQVGFRVVLAKQ